MLGERLTTAEQAEIWARWKSGEAQGVIAKAVGRPHPTIFKVLCRTGGFEPRVRHRAARVLGSGEREEISRGLAGGMTLRALARRLQRAPSTIWREVQRHGGRDAYRAAAADAAAWQDARRPKR